MNSNNLFRNYLENFVRNLRSKYREYFKHAKNLKKFCCNAETELGDEAYRVMESIATNSKDDFRDQQCRYMVDNKDPTQWKISGFPMIIIESLALVIGQFDLNDMEVVSIINILKI